MDLPELAKRTESDLNADAKDDLTHVETIITELRTDLHHEEQRIDGAKGWLIATAFIFLLFGIVLGHYTK